MGIDCTLILYVGQPMEIERLGAAYTKVVSGRLGTTTLGIRHAPNVVRHRLLSRKPRVNAIATYEKGGRYRLEISEDRINQMKRAAAAESWSLSQLLQSAWSVTREAVMKGPTDTRPDEPRQDLADDWLKAVASELSKVTGRTMWVTCCDHSCIGGYSLYADGEQLEDVSGEKDYDSVPNAAASRLAGGRQIHIHDLFARNLDREGVSTYVIADQGTPLAEPRRLDPAETASFALVL